MLKQLYLESRFLILDEPTSVLTPNEADEILGMVRDLAHAGTHHRPDHHPQVPRSDGLRRRRLGAAARRAWSAAAPVADLTPDDLARHDGGRPGDPRPRRPRHGGARGEVRLELRDIAADDDEGYAGGERRLARGARPARSSASPASPATARASWCRCWPASATRRPARCGCMASPTTRGAPRRCATKCRCCPKSRCAMPASRA